MKRLFRVLFFLFAVLYVIIHFFDSTEPEAPVVEQVDGDYDMLDTLGQYPSMIHHRVWKDLDESEHAVTFAIREADKEQSFKYRDEVNVVEDGTEKGFWHNLYLDLYDHDKKPLQSLSDSLMTLAIEDNLQEGALVYATVSMVQDIRYNYILHSDSCFTYSDYPCVPLQRYGVLSPVEFMYSLAGDCDTRTLLLFTLLKNLGYDPIIVNSYQYKHSMLAVDLPTTGDYFIHKGRKFYFWETTARGWLPGMLPPDMNNPDYWTIILDYEFQADPTRTY
ncbi:MAG TPA: hypothetical protein VG737_15175 [Cyclobacteriaceae bacterium]|nr:hypothetical protein [Cyclobacteriaceae bacterium]